MTTSTHAVNRLVAAIETSGLVAPGDHVLVAVSGGPDSMALLHALVSARPRRTITVAHFEHGMRDTRRDRGLVEAFCADHGVACRCGSGDAPARAAARGESPEEAARHLRYAFLEEAADAAGAGVVATAHTLDDHIETVLMRIMVGSGMRGLCGIPQRRGRIVRPLLAVRRAEIESYCAEHRVPFVIDPTNADTRFARNHVRHRVLPALRASLPDVEGRLLAVADTARARLVAMRSVTAPIVSAHLARENGDAWLLPLEPLARIDDAHLIVLLCDVVSDELGADAARCHYEALVRLVRRDDGAGAAVSLPGLEVRREHDGLVFTPRAQRARTRPRGDGGAHALAFPGVTRLPGVDIRFDLVEPADGPGDVCARDESGGDGRECVAYFARQSIVPPLRARRWMAGDRMNPFGMKGTKKLSDIFIDRKVPRRRRHDAWVVEDRDGIVWLVGVATRDTARVTPATTSFVRAVASFAESQPASE